MQALDIHFLPSQFEYSVTHYITNKTVKVNVLTQVVYDHANKKSKTFRPFKVVYEGTNYII